jgi:hypothetical protein
MDRQSENELLQTVLSKARKLGVVIDVELLEHEAGLEHMDALVRIGAGRGARAYAAEIKRGLRPATIGATLHALDRQDLPGLLIADYVMPPMAELLKARGIAFLDAAGNAYIDQPPVLLWVKGERPELRPNASVDTARVFRAGGLKVMFALLCHPEWAELPYRDLARRAAVAHGTVGGVVADLRQLRFIADVNGSRRLLQPQRLLRQWAEAFARTLRPKLILGRYRADQAAWWADLSLGDYGLLLGGEPAAAKLTRNLRPETITVYADKVDARFLLEHRLRPDPRGPVEFVAKFWAFGADDESLVPLPLIYADLLLTDDSRCIETADLIHEQILNGFVE